MHSVLAKLTAVGVVAAGFLFTGDLHHALSRVGQWAGGKPSPSTESLLPATAAATEQPLPAASPIASGPLAPSQPSHPFLRERDRGVPLPTLANAAIDLAHLRPGDRVLVRVRGCLVAFDMIDPAGGEALEHRHALLGPEAAATVAQRPARRVLLPRRLSVGSEVNVVSLGRPTGEPLGPILALGLEQPD